jgi:hypothetical protein
VIRFLEKFAGRPDDETKKLAFTALSIKLQSLKKIEPSAFQLFDIEKWLTVKIKSFYQGLEKR